MVNHITKKYRNKDIVVKQFLIILAPILNLGKIFFSAKLSKKIVIFVAQLYIPKN